MDNLDKLVEDLMADYLKNHPDIDNQDALMEEVVQGSVSKISDILYTSLTSSSAEMIEDQRLLRQEFEARLLRRWTKPLKLLETIIVLAMESGEEFCNDLYMEREDLENKVVVEVIVKLHVKSCRIANEILCLLKAGFAEGALARWRTLHEVTVISLFIAERGNDLAIRYLEYEDIERYRDMLEFQRQAEVLGYDPLSKEQVEAITNRKNDLIDKYGRDYTEEYGWLSHIFPKGRRNLREIESDVGTGHWRPYYRLANNYVHSGPRGTLYSLGNMEGSNVLIPGSSNYGLSTPGQNTGISLHLITTCLLTLFPTIQRLSALQVNDKFLEELCSSFAEVQKELEYEEEGNG